MSTNEYKVNGETLREMEQRQQLEQDESNRKFEKDMNLNLAIYSLVFMLGSFAITAIITMPIMWGVVILLTALKQTTPQYWPWVISLSSVGGFIGACNGFAKANRINKSNAARRRWVKGRN